MKFKHMLINVLINIMLFTDPNAKSNEMKLKWNIAYAY